MAPGPSFTHFRAQTRKWPQEAARNPFLPISEPKPENSSRKPSETHFYPFPSPSQEMAPESFHLSYRIRFCTIKYNSVLKNTILYYRIRFCTTEYDSVLPYPINLSKSYQILKLQKTVPGQKAFAVSYKISHFVTFFRLG